KSCSTRSSITAERSSSSRTTAISSSDSRRRSSKSAAARRSPTPGRIASFSGTRSTARSGIRSKGGTGRKGGICRKGGTDRKDRSGGKKAAPGPAAGRSSEPRPATKPQISHEDKKRADAEARKKQRAAQAHQAKIDALESQIAECEASIKALETTMAA